MKTVIALCLFAFSVAPLAAVQSVATPALRSGIAVKMPVANHAVAVPAADQQDATVVSITSDGRVFIAGRSVQTSALSSLHEGTVYVKADARVPYQRVLTVLDALHGRPVVLLAAPVSNGSREKIVPPYGVKVMLGGQ